MPDRGFGGYVGAVHRRWDCPKCQFGESDFEFDLRLVKTRQAGRPGSYIDEVARTPRSTPRALHLPPPGGAAQESKRREILWPCGRIESRDGDDRLGSRAKRVRQRVAVSRKSDRPHHSTAAPFRSL